MFPLLFPRLKCYLNEKRHPNHGWRTEIMSEGTIPGCRKNFDDAIDMLSGISVAVELRRYCNVDMASTTWSNVGIRPKIIPDIAA